MSEHRESRTDRRRPFDRFRGAWAVVTAGGARPGGTEWYVFEDGATNPAALQGAAGAAAAPSAEGAVCEDEPARDQARQPGADVRVRRA